MNKINNGGPAFPQDDDATGSEGMSLRDYFAAHAMNSLISAQAELRVHTKDGILIIPARDGVPMLAYQYADAMLKARKA